MSKGGGLAVISVARDGERVEERIAKNYLEGKNSVGDVLGEL